MYKLHPDSTKAIALNCNLRAKGSRELVVLPSDPSDSNLEFAIEKAQASHRKFVDDSPADSLTSFHRIY